MTNEEKAKSLFQKYKDATMLGEPLSRGSVAFQSSLEMAEWKDQQLTEEKKQLVEKACGWIKDWLLDENAGVPLTKSGVEAFVNDFKQAMEE